MRALACGCPVVVSPAGGDMAENAARVDWAGLGVRLPRRFCTPRGVRLAVRRALGRPREPVEAVVRWIAACDAGGRAGEAIERWAATRPGTP
jgi:UDP:flavonoid glycosyltransferase YjiC (YdhE family)